MKTSNKYLINIIATGVFVLIGLSALLYWDRFICQMYLHYNTVESSDYGRPEIVPQKVRSRQGASYVAYNRNSTKSLIISPSGLIPEVDDEPNLLQNSQVTAQLAPDSEEISLVLDYRKNRSKDFYLFADYKSVNPETDQTEIEKRMVYFDETAGLFVYCEMFTKMISRNKSLWDRKPLLYAGPKGVSKTADENLGRFRKPADKLWAGNPRSFIFYDKEKTQFYKIEFEKNKVVSKGYTQLIQMQSLVKNDDLINFTFSTPVREATAEEKAEGKNLTECKQHIDGKVVKTYYVEVNKVRISPNSNKKIPVVDSKGLIRLLDSETLEISKVLGSLPGAPPFRLYNNPHDLLAYEVQILEDVNDSYAGLIAASVSREGLGFAISIFDKNGKQVNHKSSLLYPAKMPGGIAMMITKYVLENLQPSVMLLGSYFSGNHFEATAGYNSLFILPNSYVAMFGRDSGNTIARFFVAIVIISPSILLGLVLGILVRKDSKAIGLSKRTQRLWLAGTICFGLSAYITYRLTRPKMTMVTCVNCGQLRRPDMENCQLCSSKWIVPELAAPTWRVIE